MRYVTIYKNKKSIVTYRKISQYNVKMVSKLVSEIRDWTIKYLNRHICLQKNGCMCLFIYRDSLHSIKQQDFMERVYLMCSYIGLAFVMS